MQIKVLFMQIMNNENWSSRVLSVDLTLIASTASPMSEPMQIDGHVAMSFQRISLEVFEYSNSFISSSSWLPYKI